MDGNELTPFEFVRMMMRTNGETMQSFCKKFGYENYQTLQKHLIKDERLRFDELYAFVKYFGGTIRIDVPMPDGRMRTIELVCKEE